MQAGTHVIGGHLTALYYMTFLENELLPHLEDQPLAPQR
jgi:hypothetical protein